jgi:DNA polymerase-1
MLAAFARDEDIHTRVASEVFHVPPEQVDSNMRRTAKAVNFGVIYGQSPFGLAKALGISQDDAAKFIDAYFAGYPGVERFLNEILAACFRDGYVKTMLGRRRTIRGIREPNTTEQSATPSGRSRNMSEREAINTVIQGSAADLIKLAMLRIQQRLQREPWEAKLILQIHDELILECSPECLNDLGQMVREEMSAAYELSVPLKVDLKSGQNWAECEPWE